MTDEELPPDAAPVPPDDANDPIPDEAGIEPGEDDPNEPNHEPVEEE